MGDWVQQFPVAGAVLGVVIIMWKYGAPLIERMSVRMDRQQEDANKCQSDQADKFTEALKDQQVRANEALKEQQGTFERNATQQVATFEKTLQLFQDEKKKP